MAILIGSLDFVTIHTDVIFYLYNDRRCTCKVIQLKLHLFIPVKGHKKLKSDLTGFGGFQFALLTSYCELKRTYVPNCCEIG